MLDTRKHIRFDVERYQLTWYEEARSVANKIGTAPNLKRNQYMKYKDCAGDKISIYFQREITIPLIDELIQEMSARFNDETLAYADSIHVIPIAMKKTAEKERDSWKLKLKRYINTKSHDMFDTGTIDAEIEL